MLVGLLDHKVSPDDETFDQHLCVIGSDHKHAYENAKEKSAIKIGNFRKSYPWWLHFLQDLALVRVRL